MSWAALPNRGICALTRSRERAPASLSNPCCAARVVGRGVSVPSRVFHTRTRPHQFATFACAARPQESNARRLSDERGPGARLSLTGPLDIAWPPARRVLAERQDRELVQVLREKGLLGFHRLSRAETQRVADALKESGLPATLDQAICYRNYIKANNDMANRGKIHAFIRGEHGYVGRRGDIERISQTLQVSPLEIVRGIMVMKYRMTELKASRFVEAMVGMLSKEVSAGRQAVDDAGLDTPSAELLEFLSRTAGVKPKSAVHKPDARAGTDQAAESAHPEGEGQKTAQFVVWTSAGGKEKKNKAKFRGNQRIAVSVAEPDWHEFRWAVHHDMQGERKELNMEKDWAVEKRLEVELRALKLPVWTESEIGEALQKKRLANPGMQNKVDWWNMSSPDFVFRKRVTIGGRTVRWLDIKNMYLPMHAGDTTRTKVDRMVTQANRYNTDWGPGGFVFQAGYCEKLRVDLADVAMVLDGSFLLHLSTDPSTGGGPIRDDLDV